MKDFQNPKVRRKMEMLTWSHLPLILISISELEPVKISHLIDYIRIDNDISIDNSSIRRAVQNAEKLGLVFRDVDSKVYRLTDLGRKEVEWIRKLVEFLAKLE